MKIVSLKDRYVREVKQKLKDAFGFRNTTQIPKIDKVTVNVGFGKIHKESQQIEDIIRSLEVITGQKPVETVTRRAIAGFKIRQGVVVGSKVTLRGARMWDFLDRLIHITIPRTRDFQGLDVSCVDAKGNMNIGIKDHVIFPEIKPEKVARSFGLQVNISTTAESQEVGLKLFRSLGFPIRK
jgi:large subunit ribosomal protein L5